MKSDTPELRRAKLADAGLALVAEHGLRGLTHRAIDRTAEVPDGTTSNYFRTRDALIAGLADRLFVRLLPSDDWLEAEAAKPATRDQWIHFMVDLVERAMAQPQLHVALWEFRLEATRRPGLVPGLTEVIRRNLEFDIAYHDQTGLPGGPDEIRLLHLALNGLILDRITLPDALGIDDVATTVATLVDRIVYGIEPGRHPTTPPAS